MEGKTNGDSETKRERCELRWAKKPKGETSKTPDENERGYL